MKRKSLIGFLIVLFFMSLIHITAETSKKKVVLKIIIPWVNEELKGFLPVIEEFEKAYPNIKIKYQTAKAEDVSTLLTTQFRAKTAPADVIDIPWAWFISKHAKDGNVLAVDSAVKESDFIKGAFDQVKINNSIYGVPGPGGITIPEYRISFFKKHNLPAPHNLNNAQFLKLLKDIRKIDGIDGAIASGGGVGWTFTSILETWILAYGGKSMHNDLMYGRIAWNSPEVIKVLSENLLPLIENGFFSDADEYETQLKSMWSGRHAIFIGDSTDSQIIDPPTDRGVFLLPNQDTVLFWNDFWFIPKYTKHPEEAKLFLKFVSGRGQEIQIANGGRIATNIKISKDVYPEAERKILDVLSNGVGVEPDLDDTIGGTFQTEIWSQLALLWGDPSQETLKNVLDRLQHEYKKNVK